MSLSIYVAKYIIDWMWTHRDTHTHTRQINDNDFNQFMNYKPCWSKTNKSQVSDRTDREQTAGKKQTSKKNKEAKKQHKQRVLGAHRIGFHMGKWQHEPIDIFQCLDFCQLGVFRYIQFAICMQLNCTRPASAALTKANQQQHPVLF